MTQLVTTLPNTTSANISDLDLPEHVPSADATTSELLVQLGYEYFTICSAATASAADAAPRGERPPRIDPQAIASTSPLKSFERDFWEEVATVSEKANSWPQTSGGLGAPRDPVACAIASVSASYTLATSERRPATPIVTPPPPLQGAPKELSKASSSEQGSQANRSQPDFVDALASLFGFEDVAALDDVRALNPETFTRSRELAAHALVAAATNFGSALKSAEGRRG